MRIFLWLFTPCLVAGAAFAAKVGDAYDQVVKEMGSPVGQMVVGTNQVLSYPQWSIKLKKGVVTSVTPVTAAGISTSKPAPAAPDGAKDDTPAASAAEALKQRREQLRLQITTSEVRIRQIVNQRVPSVPFNSELDGRLVYDGWFQPGQERPSFDGVDVRKTQKPVTGKYEYLSMSNNKAAAYFAKDVEYNPALAYFYTEPLLPKKKLTSSEMLNINNIFRIISRCENELEGLSPAYFRAKVAAEAEAEEAAEAAELAKAIEAEKAAEAAKAGKKTK